MEFSHFAKIFLAAVLGSAIAILFSRNPQILIFLLATILIFIYFELAEKKPKPKPKRKTKTKFAKEMEKFKDKL